MLKFLVASLLSFVAFTAQASYQAEYQDHLQDRFEKVQPLILEVARQQNVDPVLLTTAMYKESRFDVKAKNPKSTARGGMQMLRGTAKAMISKHGKELGIPHGANLNNPRVALKLSAAYLKDIEQEMNGRLKRPVSNSEIYLGYKFGPGTAATLIKSGKHRKRNGTIAQFKRAAAFYADLTPAAPKKKAGKSVRLAFAKTKDNDLKELQGVWQSLYGNAMTKPNPDTVLASNRNLF